MRKNHDRLKEESTIDYPFAEERFDCNVENFKRRRALTPFWRFDMESRLFFERILDVRKAKEMVFVTNGKARGR